MTWHTLIHSTTIDSSDLNDNFYHIGQGTLEPMAGQAMGFTNSSVNIGATGATFKNLYVNSITVNSTTYVNAEIWELVADTFITGTVSRAEISGLNGDDTDEFMIIAKGVGVSLTLNGDTTASIYGEQSIFAAGATPQYQRTKFKQLDFLFAGAGPTQGSGFVKMTLRTRTGQIRHGHKKSLDTATGDYIYRLWDYSFTWSNTSSTITSLVIDGSNIDDTHIKIWRKGP